MMFALFYMWDVTLCTLFSLIVCSNIIVQDRWSVQWAFASLVAFRHILVLNCYYSYLFYVVLKNKIWWWRWCLKNYFRKKTCVLLPKSAMVICSWNGLARSHHWELKLVDCYPTRSPCWIKRTDACGMWARYKAVPLAGSAGNLVNFIAMSLYCRLIASDSSYLYAVYLCCHCCGPQRQTPESEWVAYTGIGIAQQQLSDTGQPAVVLRLFAGHYTTQ